MHRIKTDDTLVAIVMIIVFICVILNIIPTKAQDTITVCRDTTVEIPRFIFRGLPASWLDGSEAWWSLVDGGGIVGDTYVADALTEYEDESLIGTATIGSTDYSIEVRGDENTAVCEGVATSAPIAPQNAANDRVEPLAVLPVSSPVVSTGRTCVVKYLKDNNVILVCEG